MDVSLRIEQRESGWDGLDIVLFQVSQRSPGVRLEHTMKEPEEESETWREGPAHKILPVENWLSIVRKDIERAPNIKALQIITGPHYLWGYDDLGRIVIGAQHRGQVVQMFVEPWAGEPEIGRVSWNS